MIEAIASAAYTETHTQAHLPHWLVQVLASLQHNAPCTLITVVHTQGSVPREPGTHMVVTADKTVGTIGGGKLEYQAIEYARALLTQTTPEPFAHVQRFVLGTNLGQCCGGVVTLHFERLSDAGQSLWPEQLAALLAAGKAGHLLSHPAEVASQSHTRRILIPTPATDDTPEIQFTAMAGTEHYLLQECIRPHDFHIALYGAGHVGQALITLLATLPCQVHWVDNRPQQFPPDLPANVTCLLVTEPAACVTDMPAGSYHLVMTHDHALDLELCDHILARQDIRFLGLIGSETKAARFRHRLHNSGIPPQQLERLICPVGIPGIHDKHPTAIAIAIVAQLLLERSKPAPSPNRRQDTHEYSPTPS